jgi:hypothetical protein
LNRFRFSQTFSLQFATGQLLYRSLKHLKCPPNVKQRSSLLKPATIQEAVRRRGKHQGSQKKKKHTTGNGSGSAANVAAAQ